MKREIKSLLFRLPGELLLFFIFLVSVYLKISGRMPMSWFAPVIFLLILISYFYGRNLKKDSWEF